jgi:cytoskeletal protein RodZ
MQFRPIEPARHARYDFGLLMPAALAVVGLLALFFAWQWAQGRKSTEPRQVRALAPAAAQATIAPQPVSPSVAATAPAPAPAAQPTPPSQPQPGSTPATGSANTVETAASAAPSSPTAAKDQQGEVTNSAAMTPPPPPKPAPLRLQAVVFNPRQPSAIISGKTLFIGDKLGDSRVVAIDRGSATLVGAGKTNVLSLPQ